MGDTSELFGSLPCYGDRKTFEKDGWEVTAELLLDEYADLSYLGTFTDKWEEGALDHHRLQGHRGRYGGEARWFIPQITAEDHRKGLRNMNYPKHEADCLARKYVRQDYERARSYGEDWNCVVVVVRVFREGIELGKASLAGIETDSGSYFDEVVDDLFDEAKEEAEQALKKLCRCGGVA